MAMDSWNSFLRMGPSIWDLISKLYNSNDEISREALRHIDNMLKEGRLSNLGEAEKEFIEEARVWIKQIH